MIALFAWFTFPVSATEISPFVNFLRPGGNNPVAKLIIKYQKTLLILQCLKKVLFFPQARQELCVILKAFHFFALKWPISC
jgi:hypothetical protein